MMCALVESLFPYSLLQVLAPVQVQKWQSTFVLFRRNHPTNHHLPSTTGSRIDHHSNQQCLGILQEESNLTLMLRQVSYTAAILSRIAMLIQV